MDPIVQKFVDFILTECPRNDKEQAEEAARSRFDLSQRSSIFYCEHFAARFCWSGNGAFSNTVMALSVLKKYDDRPVFVVLIKGSGDIELFLANSTFIEKISHSSDKLSMDKIRGSFNGPDIMRDYLGRKNNAENYKELYAFHRGLAWEDNLERLVEATAKIKGIKAKYIPENPGLRNIYASIDRTIAFINSGNYNALLADLDGRVAARTEEIGKASHIDNVNLRGNLIETLIAADEEEIKKLKSSYGRKHGLGDFKKTFGNEVALTDIKTKIISLDSNPKAYNIDKFLEEMAEGNTVFFFYFVGVNDDGSVKTILSSVFHKPLLDSLYIQHHWAGRNSRGVIQFSGKAIDEMLSEEAFHNEIDREQSVQYLRKLLDL